MLLIIAAVVPALIFLYIIYRSDRHREHPKFVLFMYVIGAISVLPAGLIEKCLLDLYTATPDPPTGFMATLVTAFFVAGITEETIKAIVFQRAVLHKRFFDEPYDGVVYAVAIGLGFATVENILYVLSDGLSTAFVRAFTAVPAHALFGVVMGSYFSKARFEGAPVWHAYIVPALLHGLYDTFALATGFWPNMLLVVYLMWLVRFAYVRGGRLLRIHDQTTTVASLS